MAFQYFIIYKPFGVLSQFTATDGKKSLKDFFDVPVNVYPVGRLDADSEGLLILTNDKALNHLLLDPTKNHEREYFVQVEGLITKQAIYQLQNGVTIKVENKKMITQKCNVFIFENPPLLPERNPAIRVRKTIPDSWIKIILTEGKNRQVRKMTAAVGFPTLRLVRYRVEKINIDKLQPGEMCMISGKELYNLLKIKNY
ncbi:MAG: pseudouridine synthase [Ginsengibacter sp.]